MTYFLSTYYRHTLVLVNPILPKSVIVCKYLLTLSPCPKVVSVTEDVSKRSILYVFSSEVECLGCIKNCVIMQQAHLWESAAGSSHQSNIICFPFPPVKQARTQRVLQPSPSFRFLFPASSPKSGHNKSPQVQCVRVILNSIPTEFPIPSSREVFRIISREFPRHVGCYYS